MSYDIIIAAAAKSELQESYNWYEDQKTGLGERFLLIIESALSSISNQPQFYPVKINTYREYVIKKFPYVIIFEVVKGENIIYILHIFNTNRNHIDKLK